MDDDQYQLFLDLLNDNDTMVNPSYVVEESVRLCSKDAVNRFGSTFLPVFYVVNFTLSFLGNAAVLLILFRYEKLRVVSNVFLLNLVISNLLFASSLPFWAAYHRSHWMFGPLLCKLVSSAYFIGFYSSVLFLALMTFDRYLAVVHAVTAARTRRTRYAVASSVAVWVVSVAASVKELVLRDVWDDPHNGLMCEESGFSEETVKRWTLVTYYQQFLLFFLLPLCTVMFCYARIAARVLSTRMAEKCRAVKLIFIIVFTFFVCWTPYNVVILLRAVRLSRAAAPPSAGCGEEDGLDFALYVSRNTAYLYCCVSPVFYTFLGKKFQSHFRRLVAAKLPCLKLYLPPSSSRSSSHKAPQSTYETATPADPGRLHTDTV